MIRAHEAYKLSLDISDILIDIEASIKNAAKHGRTSILVHNSNLNDYAVEELKSLGYKLKPAFDPRDGWVLHHISWEP